MRHATRAPQGSGGRLSSGASRIPPQAYAWRRVAAHRRRCG